MPLPNLPVPSDGECKIEIFAKRDIRKTLHNGEWWFSVKDVLEALTGTPDGTRYSRDLRRDPISNVTLMSVKDHQQMLSRDVREIVQTLITSHPLIVADSVLGEPRIAGTRMPVSIVLTALIEYGSFDDVTEEYDGVYSEKELKAAVVFARDFLEMCYERSRYTPSAR